MRDINDYTRKYYSEPGEYYQALYRKKKIIDVMSRYSHKKVLEVGCGLDALFNHIDDFDTMDVIEPSFDFYKKAIDDSNGDSRIRCYNSFFEDCIETSELKKTKYDYIILSSLLHELENPEIILNCIRQLCYSNTIVHINVPNAKSIHRLLAEKMGLIQDIYQLSEQQKNMQRNKVYDLELLSSEVIKTGFQIVESGSYFIKFLSGKQMDALITSGIAQDTIYDGLYKLGDLFKDNGSEIYVNCKII